jgi:hypothetical protein
MRIRALNREEAKMKIKTNLRAGIDLAGGRCGGRCGG